MRRAGKGRFWAAMLAALVIGSGTAVGAGVALGGDPTEVFTVYPSQNPTVVAGEPVRLRAFFCGFRRTGSQFGDDGEPQTADDQCAPARAEWSITSGKGRLSARRGRAVDFTSNAVGTVQVEVKVVRSATQTFIAFMNITVVEELEPPPVVDVPTEALVVYPFGAELEVGGSVVFTAWVCPTDAGGRAALGADGWPGNAGDGGDAIDDACALVDADWEGEGFGVAAVGSFAGIEDIGGGNPFLRYPMQGPGVNVIGSQRGTGGIRANWRHLAGGATFGIQEGGTPLMDFACLGPQRTRILVNGRAVVFAGHCGFRDDGRLPDPGPDGIMLTDDDPWNRPVDLSAFRRLGSAVTVAEDGTVTATQPGYAVVVGTDDQGRQAAANFSVFAPGQELPGQEFFARSGMPPSIFSLDLAQRADAFASSSDFIDPSVLGMGQDAVDDRVDCATGSTTTAGPGAEILGVLDLVSGGRLYSSLLMGQDPMTSLLGRSWAARQTIIFLDQPPRTRIKQVHDGVVTDGELDAKGQVIPGTEQTVGTSGDTVTFMHPIGDAMPAAVVYEGFNTAAAGDPKACDMLVSIPYPSNLPPAANGGGCVGSTGTLCLNNNRFSANVTSTATDGSPVQAGATQLADPSAGLFFFSESNTAMLVKVLNACALSDRYWVFSAATTDVEYTITVTDTQSQQVKTYFNPLGNPAAPIQDTAAFATCP